MIQDFVAASMLLKSFCKYQFGVFEEEGYLHDSLYPLTFIDGNKTEPNRGCRTDNVTLLHEFCPLGQIYDRYAPTKQNLLCLGSSAFDIILNHEDFQNQQDNFQPLYKHKSIGVRKTFRNPTYDYIYPKKSRFILVLDRTNAMQDYGRWTNLHRSVSEFLTFVPAASEISIITFGKNAVMHLPPTIITDTNRNGIIGRLPRRASTDEQVCLYCAFNVTFKALQDFQGQIEAASIIFVTASQERPEDLEILSKVFQSASIQFFSIGYPGGQYPEIAQLSSNGGRHFSIHDGPSHLYTSTSLSQIFTDILSDVEHSTYSSLHIQLYEDWKVSGSFQIEDSILDGFWVSLLIESTDQIEYFELVTPGGHTKMFPTFMDGFVQFYMKSGTYEHGLWTYKATFYRDLMTLPPKIIIKVVAIESEKEAINLEAFPGKIIYDNPENPPKLYAKITAGGGQPVMRANVIAIISSPDAKIPTKLQLEDNGNGLVDLTQNDGIYSALFPYVGQQAGFYSVQVIADDNDQQAVVPKSPQSIHHGPKCCGSRLEVKQSVGSRPFRRFSSGGSFFVNYTLSSDIDMIPPSRIIDFRRSISLVDNQHFVSFEWSAPGNDYVFGKASRYSISCYASNEELTFQSPSLPLPDVYGSRQSATIQIPIENQVVLCTINAYDEANNKGADSNVVSIFIYKALFVSTTASSSTTTVQTSSKYLDILPEKGSVDVNKAGSVIDAIFDTASQAQNGGGGVIISANTQQRNLIDVSQAATVINRDEIPYNSKTVQKFTVVHDKNPKETDRFSAYTEEAKIQIYAMTGIISCMLLVILFAFTYFVLQKRKERQTKILTNIKQNPLLLNSLSNKDDIDNPWKDQGTMIRSNIWFDTLQKSLKNSESFVNPMLTSFHSIVEDVDEEETKSKSATDKTSLASSDDAATTMLDEEPNYENHPRSKRDAAILTTVQRSKSMLITKPMTRRKSLVSNLDGDIHMRQPSIRFQSTAGRKSDKGNGNGLRRSNTFAFQGSESKTQNERRYVQRQTPLRHSNSRISEIIRQYNEAVQQNNANCSSEETKMDSLEHVIAPPAESTNDFPSALDEDWVLQKSLESKRRKRNSGELLQRQKTEEEAEENDKGIPEMIVQNDTKAAAAFVVKKGDQDQHYDFPVMPARPAIPPRAPTTKRPSAFI